MQNRKTRGGKLKLQFEPKIPAVPSPVDLQPIETQPIDLTVQEHQNFEKVAPPKPKDKQIYTKQPKKVFIDDPNVKPLNNTQTAMDFDPFADMSLLAEQTNTKKQFTEPVQTDNFVCFPDRFLIQIPAVPASIHEVKNFTPVQIIDDSVEDPQNNKKEVINFYVCTSEQPFRDL